MVIEADGSFWARGDVEGRGCMFVGAVSPGVSDASARGEFTCEITPITLDQDPFRPLQPVEPPIFGGTFQGRITVAGSLLSVALRSRRNGGDVVLLGAEMVRAGAALRGATPAIDSLLVAHFEGIGRNRFRALVQASLDLKADGSFSGTSNGCGFRGSLRPGREPFRNVWQVASGTWDCGSYVLYGSIGMDIQSLTLSVSLYTQTCGYYCVDFDLLDVALHRSGPTPPPPALDARLAGHWERAPISLDLRPDGSFALDFRAGTALCEVRGTVLPERVPNVLMASIRDGQGTCNSSPLQPVFGDFSIVADQLRVTLRSASVRLNLFETLIRTGPPR
jgi:hypothetical protein